MLNRPRRLRDNGILRDLVHETSLSLQNLIQPYFLSGESKAHEPIKGFTGVYRWGVESLKKQIELDLEGGVKSFLLFGASNQDKKDQVGTAARDPHGLLPKAISHLKKAFGDSLVLFSDVCLCPYTDHGHCGVVKKGRVDNDDSLAPLAEMALVHAEAGVDFVAPSDMMDGRVSAIRKHLDEKGFSQVGILAYSAKYASSYYGPFREALGSSPQAAESTRLRDRATYQMDFRNTQEALRELKLDLAEGADLVMVKPALPYLDIIKAFRSESTVPVVAYSVSAEFEMVKALVEKGMADERAMVIENLTAIRRAGAHMIVTYFATEIAKKGWLR